MPLSQRDQYSDRKGMGLVRLGGVLCLAGFLFGAICMTIVATMGDGEDPPKVYEQMGLASCSVFALGLILGLIGWFISLKKPEQPRLTAADVLGTQEDEEGVDDQGNGADAVDQDDSDKPDPYASDHRRRDK
ncbi:MAG: hypothetical protein AAGC72_17945 [Planctomycetota bacterium]